MGTKQDTYRKGLRIFGLNSLVLGATLATLVKDGVQVLRHQQDHIPFLTLNLLAVAVNVVAIVLMWRALSTILDNVNIPDRIDIGDDPGPAYKNQKGFSLIGILVGMAILSIVMVGTAAALNQALLTSQTADAKVSVTSVVSGTAGKAFNEATCTAAVTKVAQGFGNNIQFDDLKPGAVIPAYGLTVQSVQYNDAVLAATGYDGTKVYYGNLTLTLTSNKKILGSQTFAPRAAAAIYLKVSPTGQIVGCGPELPELPVAPAPTPRDTQADDSPDFIRGCNQIHGIYSRGACTIDHSHDHDNDHDDDHDGHSGGCDGR